MYFDQHRCTTQPSVKPEPPDGEASVKRNNQSFVVTISANPSACASPVLSHIYDHNPVMRPRQH
jgi:hypothetical protein